MVSPDSETLAGSRGFPPVAVVAKKSLGRSRFVPPLNRPRRIWLAIVSAMLMPKNAAGTAHLLRANDMHVPAWNDAAQLRAWYAGAAMLGRERVRDLFEMLNSPSLDL